MSRRNQGGGIAAWAGWLLGGALVLVLVAGALILSVDGARLRRLSAARGTAGIPGRLQGTGPEASQEYGAEREAPLLAVPASASGRGSPVSESDEAEGEGLAPGGAGKRCGWIAAEAIGPPGAVAVYVDGVLKGTAPIMLDGVERGVHKLGFAASDSVSLEEDVRVTAGDTTVVACALPDGSMLGRIVIRPAEGPGGAGGEEDSVLVDGLFVGASELSVEVSPGYHSVSFVGAGAERRDIVLHVPPGSVQYVSSPEIDPPFSIVGAPTKVEGGLLLFEARLSSGAEAPPELSLVIVPAEGISTKTASIPRGSSDSTYAGALPSGRLLSTGVIRYFFRATLSSGLEIDSPIYALERGSP